MCLLGPLFLLIWLLLLWIVSWTHCSVELFNIFHSRRTCSREWRKQLFVQSGRGIRVCPEWPLASAVKGSRGFRCQRGKHAALYWGGTIRLKCPRCVIVWLAKQFGPRPSHDSSSWLFTVQTDIELEFLSRFSICAQLLLTNFCRVCQTANRRVR